MRVLVCGGRNYDKSEVWNWLESNLTDHLHAVFGGGYLMRGVTEIIHGGARGADEGADEWGRSEGCKVKSFKADWNKHGKAAGPIRNQQMLDIGKPDVVVAFPGGKGTADMVRRARDAGIAIIEVCPRPTTTSEP